MWLSHELVSVFGVEEKLTGESAQRIYDHITAALASPEFRPRRLFERFNIEVLSTTDAATDLLEHHRAIRESGWKARIVPTFRPDAVVNLGAAGWRKNIDALSASSGIDVNGYRAFVRALENRRAFFKTMGATATDHAAQTAFTGEPVGASIVHPLDLRNVFGNRGFAIRPNGTTTSPRTGQSITPL